MRFSPAAVSRIVAAESARTAGFVLLVSLAACVGLRLCMPPVLAALSARFAVPGIPEWSPVLWFFLGGIWLMFVAVVVLGQAMDWGIWSCLAILSAVWGGAIANIVAVASTPMRVRRRVLEEHGIELVEVALSGFSAHASHEVPERSIQARLLSVGLKSYVLRQSIVQATLSARPNERETTAIALKCQTPFRQRARVVRRVMVLALVCSVAAMLVLGFGAQQLWPSPSHHR